MTTKGLFVSPRDFVSFADLKRPEAGELALRSRGAAAIGGGMYLPNPDPVLKKLGRDVTVYRDLLADAAIGGCVRRRKSAVRSLERGIERAGTQARVAKVIDQMLERLKLTKLIPEILDATLYGYQPLEVVWATEGGLWLPARVVGKPPEWFAFGRDNELRLRTPREPTAGETVPARKFLVATQEASYANPYGFPDLSRVFWPAVFKKGGLKFWVAFTEKYGSPFLVGKQPRGTNDEETDAFLDRLADMVQDAIAVIPDDSSVEILDAGGKGASAGVYRELLEFCRAEIAIALLGQNQSTEKDSTRASATAGLEVTEDIRDGDAEIVCEVVNELIDWVVDVNFGDAQRPRFNLWQQEDVDVRLAERDEKLTKAGAKLTKVYFQRRYKLADDEVEVGGSPVLPPSPGLEFAEGTEFADQDALDAALDKANESAAFTEAVEPMLRPLFDAVRDGLTAVEVQARLVRWFPLMDAGALQERVARIIFVANVWGRISADTDASGA
ncbi:DUF935 domain-containing protein [Lysobacter sp. CA196]|uniref:DUF935 domain-containing protein n=1 Tax=Lysobacter sp. CA196 TaxID=3455606 RepID=UPI003F8D3428